jgi:hypothetical protein
MRVGIFTFHYVLNYGAVLQALGLQKAIQSLGYTPEFIDYLPACDRRYRKYFFGYPGGFRSGHIISGARLQREFRKFRAKHLFLSRAYDTCTEIVKDADCYSAFVVGSDQVWNCKRLLQRGFDPDPAYFLRFAEGTGVRRVSYAACFGRPDQPEERCAEIGRSLRTFDKLSVRNCFSRDLVRELSSRDSSLVVDPVFLTNFEKEADPQKENQPYLLIYSVSRASGHKYAQAIMNLARKLSLRTVAITRDNISGVDEYRRDASPSKWLALFRDASYVCTNSFHGAAFSIKYKKPFSVFVDSDWRALRMLDLLRRYNLDSRVISDPTVAINSDEINYDQVHENIARDVRDSYEYLKTALA